MQGSSFRLIVRRGPQPNQIYELDKSISTLGRDITNDIVINDPEVSRHHCRLTQGGGGFTIEDLGSTNGTFINGQRLTGARPLTPGDMVGLGETVTLAYEFGRKWHAGQPCTAFNDGERRADFGPLYPFGPWRVQPAAASSWCSTGARRIFRRGPTALRRGAPAADGL